MSRQQSPRLAVPPELQRMAQAEVVARQLHMNIASSIYARMLPYELEVDTGRIGDEAMNKLADIATRAASVLLNRYGMDVRIVKQEGE